MISSPPSRVTFVPPADHGFHFLVRYRSAAVAGGVPWLDYSRHPATKLGLHNAMLAVHDRREVLAARGGWYECGLFVEHREIAEPLSQAGAERLFAALPHGDVKWLDLCRCLLPEIPAPPATSPSTAADLAALPSNSATVDASAAQLPLFPHTHTLYDDLEAVPEHHLDTAA